MKCMTMAVRMLDEENRRDLTFHLQMHNVSSRSSSSEAGGGLCSVRRVSIYTRTSSSGARNTPTFSGRFRYPS